MGREPELIDVNKDHLASPRSLITGDKSVNADTGSQSPVKDDGGCPGLGQWEWRAVSELVTHCGGSGNEI